MTHSEKLRAEIGNRFVGTEAQAVFQAIADYLHFLELRVEALEATTLKSTSPLFNRGIYQTGHATTNTDDGGQPFCDDSTAL